MCICVPVIMGRGGNSISTYSWPITNSYPPYSMKELGCINSVHTLFSECAKCVMWGTSACHIFVKILTILCTT